MTTRTPILLKKLTRHYWSSRGRGYDKAPGHSGFEHVWARLLKLAMECKASTLRQRAIDLGCGTGFLAKILASENTHVICLDIAEGMLREAKRKLRRNLNVDYIQADCEQYIPIRDSSIDIAVSRHVLWTLTTPHIAVAKWLQIIRKGGILVIFDGSWHSERSLLKRLLRSLYVTLRSVLRDKIDPIVAVRYNIIRVVRKIDNIDLLIDLLKNLPIRYRIRDLSKLRELTRGRYSLCRALLDNMRYYMIIICR